MPFLKKAFAAAILLPFALSAQAGPKEVTTPAPTVVTPEKKSLWRAEANVQVVSEYINYGVLWHRNGVDIQPSVDIGITLYEGDGIINSVSFDAGVWQNNTTARQNTTGRPVVGGAGRGAAESQRGTTFLSRKLGSTELDIYAGISTTFAKNFNLSVNYLRLDWFDRVTAGAFDEVTETSGPSHRIPTSHNINLVLTYDDSDFLKKFALHPHFTYLHEFSGGITNDSSYGNYYEFGIAPAIPTYTIVELTLPVKIGLGSDGFYRKGRVADGANETYGYMAAGLDASVPLNFIPKRYGTWKANAAAIYYNLSQSNVNLYKDTSRNRYVLSGGLNVSF